ncbi:uncharacterized protein CLUP02_08693 [Colletotrichum lupini]|uniref:Uncharacterized protein n=1 Tax=Colletotrichum lupini TaxID=145971 RepID=A0A9Q8WH41_9PEZI|nr:uncharacterized protein CLUP02_08693 [Colletotrichum lupini]UQC83199.1 hypothetical protein CLUP02_08693 [Colletotrichum lupini]
MTRILLTLAASVTKTSRSMVSGASCGCIWPALRKLPVCRARSRQDELDQVEEGPLLFHLVNTPEAGFSCLLPTFGDGLSSRPQSTTIPLMKPEMPYLTPLNLSRFTSPLRPAPYTSIFVGVLGTFHEVTKANWALGLENGVSIRPLWEKLKTVFDLLGIHLASRIGPRARESLEKQTCLVLYVTDSRTQCDGTVYWDNLWSPKLMDIDCENLETRARIGEPNAFDLSLGANDYVALDSSHGYRRRDVPELSMTAYRLCLHNATHGTCSAKGFVDAKVASRAFLRTARRKRRHEKAVLIYCSLPPRPFQVTSLIQIILFMNAYLAPMGYPVDRARALHQIRVMYSILAFRRERSIKTSAGDRVLRSRSPFAGAKFT